MATKDLESSPQPENGTADSTSASASKKRKSKELSEIEVDLSLPEPPSKKAKRLLKKGKNPSRPANSDNENDNSDDEAGGDGKDKDKKKKKKERSEHGVWIGNLRFNATKAELRKWLVDNSGGSITDDLITRIHMPTTKPVAPKKTSENRGFAYVDFSTFEANVAAIALSETELAGRKVLIKDSRSFEGRPKKEEPAEPTTNSDQKGGAKEEVKGGTKIFVGNLSFQTTEDDVHAHFEKCGKIRWVKVATFEDTGKCKGYGWVNFEDSEAANWAVKGFVKVREEIPTLEDFVDKPAEEQDEDTEAKGEKRIKTRKWWVNQLFGRPLKIELAEDDQVRYKKRFGKGAQKAEQTKNNGRQQQQQQQQREGADGDAPITEERQKKWQPREKKEKREMNYANDVSVARLTGAVVAHQGKKTTFD
ncbi:hypothetical protein QBC46DRAFT_256703 [Diplogelasinospora grovesii]|uniref:RRM domain-containing protein n=1 Tax=Diplogelasinospora grovesii TaxID=303347 RepID=A0AAN6NC61_9PEZI|nr:hypothetical protein QBC46DRAFT_256703 [Diplogelasinospora grovesii]